MNRTRSIAIVLSVAAVCIALILMLPAVLSARTYRAANALYDAGQYEEALAAFEALGAYRDSAALAGACRSAIAQQKYDAAKALYDAGEYAPAYPLLNGLSFSNSAELAAKCLYRIQADRLTGAAAGDTIRFGSYEQDNDLSNGAEEIEWIVLDVDKNAALVISKYVLDIGAFNDEYSESSNITWGICQLRGWLNGPFYSAAFGPDHRGRILTSEVPAGEKPGILRQAGEGHEGQNLSSQHGGSIPVFRFGQRAAVLWNAVQLCGRRGNRRRRRMLLVAAIARH